MTLRTLGTNVASLNNAFVGQVNGFRDMVAKLRNQQNAVNLLIVGDSTTDLTNGSGKWTSGLAAAIGALYPTHTVYQRTFDYTTTNDWNAATTIQTGTGYNSDLGTPPTLTVWVAGYAGHNWSDFLIDSRRKTVFATPSPDVVVFSFGHNDGTTAFATETIRSRNLAYIEWAARLSAPKAQIVLSSQNPRSITPGHAEWRNDIYRSIARQRGYGYVNITQAFHDDGRSLAVNGPLVDSTGVHPTTAGYDLWRSTFLLQIVTAKNATPLTTSVPAFTTLANRVAGMNTVPVLSNGWTASNVTEAVEGTIVRGSRTSSIKLTKTAGGSTAYVQRTVPLADVKGRAATIVAWVYVPSAVADVKITAGWIVDGALAVASTPDFVLLDQWYPLVLTTEVPYTATTAVARLWVDNDTSADTPSIYVDTLDVILGDQPAGIASSGSSSSGVYGVSTWATGTTYSTGDAVMFNGAMYQATVGHTASAAFRTDLAAGNWTHINGHGRVESLDPDLCTGVNVFPTALRAYYFRVASAAAISNLLVEIGIQSGNILLGVYANNGLQGRAAAPGARLGTTGAVACPAVGLATLSLGATIGVAAGDWLMLSADNITVKFRTPAGFAGASGVSTGRSGFEILGSLAAPASAAALAYTPNYVAWIGAS